MTKKYASFGIRAVAVIIDILVFLPVDLILSNSTYQSPGFILLLVTAYSVWMHGTYGASIGKMVMKIKVTKASGAALNYSDALLREIAAYLSFVIFGLGYLSVLWDKRNQSWHDKIAKTIVVHD